MHTDGSHRPIAGHHFNELLICPHRAWLAYHGDLSARMRDPAPLRSLQQAGIQHERAIYSRLYPDAVRIPENQPRRQRQEQTVDAMRMGVPTILQGYVQTDDGVGVIDVLTLVGPDPHSRTGHAYRVGEIKRAEVLRTAHVFQASWYTDLLWQTQSQTAHEAFFILADGQPQFIDLRTLAADYRRARDELQRLRAGAPAPGPHFAPACLTCAWRGVCLPALVRERDLSLLPGISRRQAEMLRERGFRVWSDVASAHSDLLEEIGLAPLASLVLPEALSRLAQGRPPLRIPLRPGLLSSATAVALEFPRLGEELRSGQVPTPTAVYYDQGGTPRSTPVTRNGEGQFEADLAPLQSSHHLVTFGAIDTAGLRRLLRDTGMRRGLRLINLLDFVEQYLHYPTLGLELETLLACAGSAPPEPLRASGRVAALRRIIEWIT